MKLPLLIPALIFSIGCSSGPSGKVSDAQREKIEAELKAGSEKFIQAAISKNATEALSGFSEDGIFYSDPGTTGKIVGHAGYKSMMNFAFKYLDVIDIQSIPEETLIINDSSVIQSGRWKETVVYLAESDTVRSNGYFMSYLKKQKDGSWKVHRLIRNYSD